MAEQIWETIGGEAPGVEDPYRLAQEGVFEGNETYWDTVEYNRATMEFYRAVGIDVTVERTHLAELDNFNPEDCEKTDQIYGHPEAAIEYWEEQEGPTCALHAQRAIIEEITGVDIDPDAMQAVAEAYGWYDNGTALENMNKMLDYCGIPNETMEGMTYEQLRECLQKGERIIAAVDSDEYWVGEYDNLFQGEAPDHAVEVIGIDESDPQRPMVILNDSGVPNGRGLRVPADTFLEAWEDSNFYAIRVPVYGQAGQEGQSAAAKEPGKIGYSSSYYEHEMAVALEQGNQIAYENARHNWAREKAKEQTS